MQSACHGILLKSSRNHPINFSTLDSGGCRQFVRWIPRSLGLLIPRSLLRHFQQTLAATTRWRAHCIQLPKAPRNINGSPFGAIGLIQTGATERSKGLGFAPFGSPSRARRPWTRGIRLAESRAHSARQAVMRCSTSCSWRALGKKQHYTSETGKNGKPWFLL